MPYHDIQEYQRGCTYQSRAAAWQGNSPAVEAKPKHFELRRKDLMVAAMLWMIVPLTYCYPMWRQSPAWK